MNPVISRRWMLGALVFDVQEVTVGFPGCWGGLMDGGCLGMRMRDEPSGLGGVTGSAGASPPPSPPLLTRPRPPTCLSAPSVCPAPAGAEAPPPGSRLLCRLSPPLSPCCGLARRRSFLTTKVQRLVFSTEEGWLRVLPSKRIHLFFLFSFLSFMNAGGIKHLFAVSDSE